MANKLPAPTVSSLPAAPAGHPLALRERLPADRNPAAVYLASLSAGSRPAQRSALNKVAELVGLTAETLDWRKLNYSYVQAIRSKLADRYAAPTANRLLTALRRVMREAWLLEYIPEAEYRKITAVKPVTVKRDDVEAELAGRALTVGELTALLNACSQDKTLAGARDAAIIALGYGLGLRRVEVARAELVDYKAQDGVLTVAHGKGNKSRSLPVDDGVRDALEDWLRVRGAAPGPLFGGINKGGRLSSSRLNARAIHELFGKRCSQAGIKDAAYHDLRRSFISDLLDRGVDVVTVAKLAGHNDPATTLRYDRRKMETRRTALQSLHIPYTRREVVR